MRQNKEEAVADLSMAEVSAETRAAVLADLAETVARLFKERFPGSDGYVHKKDT